MQSLVYITLVKNTIMRKQNELENGPNRLTVKRTADGE